jgi:hypothetical protein
MAYEAQMPSLYVRGICLEMLKIRDFGKMSALRGQSFDSSSEHHSFQGYVILSSLSNHLGLRCQDWYIAVISA